MKKFGLKRAGAVLMAFMLAFTGTGAVPASGAEEKEVILVTPFEGQSKYYGQTKTFIEDEHYSLSGETEMKDWKLDIESEEVGLHPYVLKGEVEGEDQVVELAPNAPQFEVKEYITEAEAEPAAGNYIVTGPAVTLAADGYLISGEKEEDEWNWEEELEIDNLVEGKNDITYYLRSNLSDATRKAIDQRPRHITIEKDTIRPEINLLSGGEGSTDVTAEGSIKGSEAGVYYYMVAPEKYSQEITKQLIQENVASKYGIVGYGRVDGVNPAVLNIQGLVAQTRYCIHAYMIDRAGNESDIVISEPFETDKMAVSGSVEVSGKTEVNSTLKATPSLESVDPGNLSYQWYRIKVAGDDKELDEVVDNTGGAEEDDLEASDTEDDEDDEEAEEAEEENDSASSALDQAEESGGNDEIDSIDGAELISGADKAEYKVTRADIGYHLIACVRAENYSGYVAGASEGFVEKLMPVFTMPAIAGAVYSPVRKLSSIGLPKQWNWVDSSIVPVYGNSGYRARYLPEETSVYKTVIVRVKVPVNRKNLTKSMVAVPKKRAYTGKAIKNNFNLEDQNTDLEPGKDFEVSYKNNKKVGTAKLTFTGMGNYAGTVRATYKIKKKSVKSLTCRYKKSKSYTGKKRTAGLVLKNGSVRLKKGRDYTAVYKKNKEIGKAAIAIRGKGNYKGKRTLHFSIVPRKASIRKVVRKKGGFKLTLSGKKEGKGFYVQISPVRSFKKSKRQEYTTQSKDFGVRSLEKKSTWYVRVRSYTVKKGKVYVSGFSKVRKVKVK